MIDNKLGKKIGEGGNSEVFEWEGSDKIIKLAKSNMDEMALQREFHNTLAVWEMGLPAVKPMEIVEVNHQAGIVFERVHGESMMERLIKNLANQNNEYKSEPSDVRLIARLLSEVHRFSNEKLLHQREHLKVQIYNASYLSEKEKEVVIEKLASLPIKNQVCHGDPNPGNIFMRDGRLVFIDWMDTTNGNPEADIAEFIIMVKYAILPPNIPENIAHAFDFLREQIIHDFMDEYTLQTGITYNDVDPWLAPIAARKLNADAISVEEKQLLLREIRSRL